MLTFSHHSTGASMGTTASLARYQRNLDEAQRKAALYDAIVPRFNAMAVALRITSDAVKAAQSYEELATQVKRHETRQHRHGVTNPRRSE